jgi:predicted Zn-dependent protease
MPRRGSRWVWVGLVVVLLLAIGGAAYVVWDTLRTNHHRDAARRALERYDYAEAAMHLDRYLALRPDDRDARLLAAQTARRDGRLGEAMRRLNDAKKQGVPASAVAAERELLAIQSGDLSRSAGLVQFCADNPDNPEAGLALEALAEGALKAFDLGRARWAIGLWLRHRSSDAAQARGLTWQGRAHEFAQDFGKALADFRRATELAPDDPAVRLKLAEALIREEPREAVPHLERLQRLRPDDPEVRFQTARLRRALGQPEEAAPLLDELLADEPQRVAALVERGRVAMDLNRPGEAEDWLRRALARAPELRDVNLALADCLRQCGRLDEAKQFQDKVREIDARLQKVLDALSKGS